METFTIDLTGIGSEIGVAIGGFMPLFLAACGLAIGAGALSWGLDLLKQWRVDRKYGRRTPLYPKDTDWSVDD